MSPLNVNAQASWEEPPSVELCFACKSRGFRRSFIESKFDVSILNFTRAVGSLRQPLVCAAKSHVGFSCLVNCNIFNQLKRREETKQTKAPGGEQLSYQTPSATFSGLHHGRRILVDTRMDCFAQYA